MRLIIHAKLTIIKKKRLFSSQSFGVPDNFCCVHYLYYEIYGKDSKFIITFSDFEDQSQHREGFADSETTLTSNYICSFWRSKLRGSLHHLCKSGFYKGNGGEVPSCRQYISGDRTGCKGHSKRTSGVVSAQRQLSRRLQSSNFFVKQT